MNGVKRYVTGLNEFSPEVKMLPKTEKEAKIKEIRSVVAQLEAELAANVVDPDDKDFWNKDCIKCYYQAEYEQNLNKLYRYH